MAGKAEYNTIQCRRRIAGDEGENEHRKGSELFGKTVPALQRRCKRHPGTLGRLSEYDESYESKAR